MDYCVSEDSGLRYGFLNAEIVPFIFTQLGRWVLHLFTRSIYPNTRVFCCQTTRLRITHGRLVRLFLREQVE